MEEGAVIPGCPKGRPGTQAHPHFRKGLQAVFLSSGLAGGTGAPE